MVHVADTRSAVDASTDMPTAFTALSMSWPVPPGLASDICNRKGIPKQPPVQSAALPNQPCCIASLMRHFPSIRLSPCSMHTEHQLPSTTRQCLPDLTLSMRSQPFMVYVLYRRVAPPQRCLCVIKAS